VAVAGQRHEGDTHPKRLQTAGRAVIGKRIKRDVDGAETLQMGGMLQVRRQNVNALRGNASGFEAAPETCADGRIVTGEVFEGQMGTVNPAQDLGPGVERSIRELSEIIVGPNVRKPRFRTGGTWSGGRDSGSG
jgi:hypothetical protein